jgi:hypothetical protein
MRCYWTTNQFSEKRSISALDMEIRELRLHKMPSEEDTTTRLSVEFESLYSFLEIDNRKIFL